ncbi:MAG: tetratricopeptide repeat protein [Alphaproteobacteria bacterium]|nr:tetratricopeptide repeat protein [Alphaproteobacteria bacterium]
MNSLFMNSISIRILLLSFFCACCSYSTYATSDFSTLEETVRNNTGEIEELKMEVAELKVKLAELLQEGDIGDILLKKGEYEEASKFFVKKYKEVRGKNGEKAAEALYKLAVCFENMPDNSSKEENKKKAKISYEKLKADYPKSTFAKDAEIALKRLNEKVIRSDNKK